MICKNCETPLKDGVKFCHACGKPVEVAEPKIVVEAVEPVKVVDVMEPTPEKPQKPVIPPEYQPLGAWRFFWLQVLFSLPIVGLVFLIIFSFSNGNLSRRNFARSHWCGYLILAIALAVILTLYIILFAILGAGAMNAAGAETIFY